MGVRKVSGRKKNPPRRRYFLGLGGNEGDPAANLREAVHRLEAAGIRTVRASPIYRTEPVGFTDQPWFLNQALDVDTRLPPSALLRAVKKIEKDMGRRPGPKNGPRPIDIDILLAGDAVIRTSGLTVPHPRLAERRFVLVPLAALSPEAIHPALGKKIRALLRSCPDRSKVVRLRITSSKRRYPGRD